MAGIKHGFIALAIVAVLAVAGCASDAQEQKSDTPAPDSRFHALEADVKYDVFYDQVTGVYYALFIKESTQYGVWKDTSIAVTPLLNPDGTPSRVDDAEMAEVRDDIARNMQRWQEAGGENQ